MTVSGCFSNRPVTILHSDFTRQPSPSVIYLGVNLTNAHNPSIRLLPDSSWSLPRHGQLSCFISCNNQPTIVMKINWAETRVITGRIREKAINESCTSIPSLIHNLLQNPNYDKHALLKSTPIFYITLMIWCFVFLGQSSSI